MSKNLGYLSGRKGLNYNLFEELGISAASTGTPDPDQMEKLRTEFLFGSANIYGTVSFYDFLKKENQGKKVYLCNGSACMTAGTQTHVKNTLDQHFDPSEIGEMCCLGRCHENSAFHYNGTNFSGDAINQISGILQGQTSGQDNYQVSCLGTPVLTSADLVREKFALLLQKCMASGYEKITEALKISGLRGRGGAGFPISFKLSSCRDTPSDIRFIVCNADEGDPGAYSDRYIMEHQPYKLLLGMMAAGYAAGAQWGVLYIRAEYPESIDTVTAAIQNLYAWGYCGENILQTGFTFHFKIIKAQGAYICGEETALLSSIEGQRPEVRVRPPYPTQQGLFNMPTVVNNVETLACIPFILEDGGEAFAAIGRGRSTGTKLVSLDGYFNRPGIYEVDMGTPLNQVIDFGEGFRSAVKAMHIGGPLGGLVPVQMAEVLTMDFESFQQNGFLLGHASVVCIPEDFPIVRYIRHLFQFTAHESCGKCFPCRLGSTRGAEMLEKAMQQDYKIPSDLFQDLLDTLETGSLCALGGGLPLPIKNALTYFEHELSTYFQKN